MWYDYQCEDCGNFVEDVSQGISDKPDTECQVCKSHNYHRVIYAPKVFVRGEPTTLGQLAEVNSKKLGKTKTEEMIGRDKSSKKNALKEARKELNSNLGKMTESQKKRYIENG